MHDLPTGSHSQAAFPVEKGQPRAVRRLSLPMDCLRGQHTILGPRNGWLLMGDRDGRRYTIAAHDLLKQTGTH